MIEDSDREEIEKLLPWYVTGKLAPSDTSKVERFLAEHPDALSQLQLIGTERQETAHANEAMGWPRSGMSDRLMASLPDSVASSRGHGRFAKFGQFLRMPPVLRAQWAALAMALLILGQAAFIAVLLTREPTYRLAAGAHADGAAALIAFADDAKASDIARFLANFEATIVDGPKPGGVYKIRLRKPDKSQPDDILLSKLAEHRDVVRIVLPSRD
jgi:anti-sigma factor RsiW